ncbi:MAG TPA: pitrilysin family protein, partial [Candidatus Dormibacteraeota bacterium]|nr:pitrilysin family protein [Candidatus Dormibacteraeota bacterium]
VILAERHEVPLVHFWMAVDAGYAADQLAAPGTATMTSSLLDGGTSTRNALQISDQLALLGAQLRAFSNLDLSIVQLSCLKGKLDLSLDLFADVILNPVFPESDFKRQQKQTLAAIEREQNTPQLMALRVLPGLLYGSSHVYGNPLTGSGTTESVSKMTRDDLVKLHQTWYHPNNATLVIVGDTTLAEIKPKLEKLLANWKAGQVPKKNIASVSLPPKASVYLIDKPGAIQSVIITGSVAPPKANPQEIAMEAMNDALGGIFGSRLNMNLREDKHWSYGARTLLVAARAQRPFLSISPVQTDKTKESLVEINKEFRGILGERPLTADELAKIQANETLRLPGSRETQGEVGQSILDLVQFGLPDDYYETYATKVRTLKIADVEAAAKAIVHPDNLVWVIVGDRSKIEAGVKELNFGELRFLTPDGKPI